MKNVILLAFISICLVACTSSTEKKQNENIELVKNYIKSVEELDFDSMGKFLDENYLGMGPSYGDSINKNQAVENWKSNVENLYEKIQYTRSRFAAVTIPDGESKGEWVANWAELNIIYKNGKGSVTIWANTNYLVQDGKIIKSLTFYNEADAMRQLGYTMVPLAGKE
jgi:predicted ester cyclase